MTGERPPAEIRPPFRLLAGVLAAAAILALPFGVVLVIMHPAETTGWGLLTAAVSGLLMFGSLAWRCRQFGS